MLDPVKEIALSAIGLWLMYSIALIMFVRFVLNPTFPDEGYRD